MQSINQQPNNQRQGVMKIICFLVLLFSYAYQIDIYYQKMADGKFIVAAPTSSYVQSPKLFRHHLSTIFQFPKHEQINLDEYLKYQNVRDQKVLKKVKNVCINGKQNLSPKEKLQQFKKGPCSPVVIVPGILATSIQITIDCEALQKYKSGQIFKNCGWDGCSPLSLKKPDSHYIIWVGLELTLKLTQGFSKCFGDLFGLIYDANTTNNFGSHYVNPAGINSTWLGNSDYTKRISKCGTTAIRDLSGFVSLLSIIEDQCALNNFGRLLDILEAMGYQPGITLQALPYDFRQGIASSSTKTLFPQIINNLYFTSGKKVVIVAHSLGTLHTLSGLAFSLSKEQKQKMIRHYIPITPPWMGTVAGMRNLLYGDPSYLSNLRLLIGINRYAQMKFARSSGSTYDLFLKDTFKRYRQEPWMKQVLKRIKYQQEGKNNRNSDQEDGLQKIPLSWFPSKYELCFDQAFKKNPYCQLGLIDFQESPIFIIEGKQYYGNQEDLRALLKDNMPKDQIQQALKLWEQTKTKGESLRQIPSPGVQTSIIFTTLFETQKFYNYSKKPTVSLKDNQFILPSNITYSPGDISVPSFSPLTFVAKWIYQRQQNKSIPPIHVIEYCGKYRGDNEYYSTLSCQCYDQPLKNPILCTHPCIVSDKYLISFILGILSNQSKGYKDEKLNDALIFTDQQLIDMKERCKNLQPESRLKSNIKSNQ